MHNAPSVAYPVVRSLRVAAVLLVPALAGFACIVGWAWSAGNSAGLLQGLLIAGSLGVMLWTVLGWHRSRSGVLTWDGAEWHWSAGVAGTGLPTVCLDLQSMLLLRWDASRADGSLEGDAKGCVTEWLWLESSRSPERWGDLRRAVYSRANPDARPGAEPPAATP